MGSPRHNDDKKSARPRRQRQRELVRLYERSPIKHTLGLSLSYDAKGRAVFRLPYNPGLDNAQGGVHGGILATLLDKAGWFTAAVHYDTWIATASLEVKLLQVVCGEKLRATGELVRAGGHLAVCRMEVRTGRGRLVAVGSGTFAVTSVPFSLADNHVRVRGHHGA